MIYIAEKFFLHYIEPVMAVILQFDPNGVREIMW